jgi:hypothetical protein
MTAIETTPLDLEASGYGLEDKQPQPERDPDTAAQARRLDGALATRMTGVEVVEVPPDHVTTS